MKAEDIKKLSAPFPRDAVSWRAQTLSQDGNKALALAYIDARDVMDRLDDVCGPENWQDRYEFHGPRSICYLSIRIDGEWITKADGAGDSDVEAEKGAISDALKRSAVKWGIGRYLYNMPNVWAPCESYDKGGKKYWKRWTGDPWDSVRNAPDVPAKPSQPAKQEAQKPADTTPPKHVNYDTLVKELNLCRMSADIGRAWRDNEFVTLREQMPPYWQAKLKDEATRIGNELKAKEAATKSKDTVDAILETFPGSRVTDVKIHNVEGRELHPMEGM